MGDTYAYPQHVINPAGNKAHAISLGERCPLHTKYHGTENLQYLFENWSLIEFGKMFTDLFYLLRVFVIPLVRESNSVEVFESGPQGQTSAKIFDYYLFFCLKSIP